MQYPVAIEPGDEKTAFGVVVPDLPGCFSAGDTIDQAMAGAAEAMAAWIEATREAGGVVPAASTLEALRADPSFDGWTFALVSVEIDSPLAGDHTAARRRAGSP